MFLLIILSSWPVKKGSQGWTSRQKPEGRSWCISNEGRLLTGFFLSAFLTLLSSSTQDGHHIQWSESAHINQQLRISLRACLHAILWKPFSIECLSSQVILGCVNLKETRTRSEQLIPCQFDKLIQHQLTVIFPFMFTPSYQINITT